MIFNMDKKASNSHSDLTWPLGDLLPLLDLDDGPINIDPAYYIYNTLLVSTVGRLHRFSHSIAIAQTPQELQALWQQLDETATTVDAVTHAITSSTRQTERGVPASKRAREALRSLFCIELCVVENGVLLAVAAGRFDDVLVRLQGETGVFSGLQRMAQGLRRLLVSTGAVMQLEGVLTGSA